MELIEKQDGGLPTLLFSDDGVGLTEEELHRFLATIGESSKRETLEARRNDFIGQFGIGLLSCFMVCDEIVVVTRSAKGGWRAPWSGGAGMTAPTPCEPSEHPLAQPGTQVFLVARADAAEYFTAERVRQLAAHYGGLLPFPIHLTAGRAHRDAQRRPRRPGAASTRARRSAARRCWPTAARCSTPTSWTASPCAPRRATWTGVAFVLPYSPNFNARQKHRVYLKDMLLSESAENLLPEWAFFVKCVVNAKGLRPTASREAFYEDDTLARARDALGRVRCASTWWTSPTQDPRTLQRLIALHGLAVKALALDDDDFYRLVIDWLPFETTLGMMTLGRLPRDLPHGALRRRRWMPSGRWRAWRRPRGCASSTAAYTHDTALLEKLPRVLPDAQVELFSAAQLPQGFEELTPEEQPDGGAAAAGGHGRRWSRSAAQVSIKKFLPPEVPTLYGDVDDGAFRRDVERAREETDELYASVLEGALSESQRGGAAAAAVLQPPQPRGAPAGAGPGRGAAQAVGGDAVRAGAAAGPPPAQRAGDGAAQPGAARPHRRAPGRRRRHRGSPLTEQDWREQVQDSSGARRGWSRARPR